jgi:hypothetical protein
MRVIATITVDAPRSDVRDRGVGAHGDRGSTLISAAAPGSNGLAASQERRLGGL